MNEAIRMQVAAFVDGELPETEADLLVRRLSQDAVLRQQVSEYLAIGRVMRGEYNVTGADELRERIAAELDERPLQETGDGVASSQSFRVVRPLTGFAIAASVALVAILGLRQTIGFGTDPGIDVAPVADESVESYTVPSTPDDELRQYLMLHGDASAEISGGNFNARRTAAQLRAEEIVDEAVEEEDPAADESDEPGESEAVTDQR